MPSEATRRLKEAWDKYKGNNGPNKSKPIDDHLRSGDLEDKGWPKDSTNPEVQARRERILNAAADARARGVEPANDPEFTRIVDEERRASDPSYNPEQLAKLRKSTGAWEPSPQHVEHMQKLQAQMVVDATDVTGKQYETAEAEAIRENSREVDPVTGYAPDDVNSSTPFSARSEAFAAEVPDELLNDQETVEERTWSKWPDIPVGSKLDQEGIYTDRD